MYQLNNYPRESILSQYIQEKNKQLKEFLEKEKELQDSFFGRHPFSGGEFRRPLTAAGYAARGVDDPSGFMATPPGAEPQQSVGISSELVHDITEIARFCTETKMQQDRQQEELKKLSSALRTREAEAARLVEKVHDHELTQRIRNELFVKQIAGLKQEIRALTSAVEHLRSSPAIQKSAATTETDVIQTGSAENTGPSMQTLEAMYIIGDTEYVVQAVLPTTGAVNDQVLGKVVAETEDAVEVSERISGAKSDEESQISVFSY
ncbi:hypothetical protein D0Z00_000180 [Geotrichum galactomycetum]|uniref:Uncharacterized protein n=1 Tax=Geotrichum galactomycetum TaxID=27317 RepID=A0ACB6VAM4_9ASCO|nr:hypothetical protein D0Z00_000180 [Geotrichum candidum]